MFEGYCMDVFDILFILIFQHDLDKILQGEAHPRLGESLSQEKSEVPRTNLCFCIFVVVADVRDTFNIFLNKVISLGAVYTGRSFILQRLVKIGFIEESVKIAKTLPRDKNFVDVSNGTFFPFPQRFDEVRKIKFFEFCVNGCFVLLCFFVCTCLWHIE